MQPSITDLNISKNRDFIKLKNLLAKHTKRAYFVGGFVRDLFLNQQSSDVDIEVYDISLAKFEALMNEIGADGVGKSYFVYKFGKLDISLPRTENKIGEGHKAYEVQICSDAKLAAKRRDFTINSIMINIFSGEILDFYGGRDDLKKSLLRVVDKDTFAEDSLRVLRGVQFVARFGLGVEKTSFEFMKSINLSDLSKDRISSELIKLFKAKDRALGFRLLCKLELDEFLFGVKFNKFKAEEFAKFLEEKGKFIKNEMFFLYALTNVFNLDKIEILNRLNLNTKYKKIIKEPYFARVNRQNLMKIALEMPLNQWLGLYSKNRIKVARELKIYECKFEPKIDIEAILNAGFKNKEISSEIKKAQDLAIKNYLAN